MIYFLFYARTRFLAVAALLDVCVCVLSGRVAAQNQNYTHNPNIDVNRTHTSGRIYDSTGSGDAVGEKRNDAHISPVRARNPGDCVRHIQSDLFSYNNSTLSRIIHIVYTRDNTSVHTRMNANVLR